MILRWNQILFVLVLYFVGAITYSKNSGSGSGFSSVVKHVMRTNNSSNVTNQVPHKKPEHLRIIGGEETKRNEFPFIVSLARPRHGGHFCGGSIIDPEWVLTAAHCASEPDFSVTAGEHNLNVNEGTEQKTKATMVIRHPHYNPITYEDDICLVKVSPPFRYDKYVQPFAIPTAHYVATGNSTVAGWGTEDEFNQAVSPVLRKVSIPLVDNMDCAAQYGQYFHARKMMCAGLEEGGKDACQGDSGGPILCDDYHKGAVLCGIVSFGLGCARPELAGVYTKVTYYRDWMEYEMRRNTQGKGVIGGGGNTGGGSGTGSNYGGGGIVPPSHVRTPKPTTTTTTRATPRPQQPPPPPPGSNNPGYQIPPGSTIVIIKPPNPNENRTGSYVPPIPGAGQVPPYGHNQGQGHGYGYEQERPTRYPGRRRNGAEGFKTQFKMTHLIMIVTLSISFVLW